jgi:hypothetical protein
MAQGGPEQEHQMEKFRLGFAIDDRELFMNIDMESESSARDEAYKIMNVLMQSACFVRLLSVKKI